MRRAVVAVLTLLALASPVAAQEPQTRAEELRQLREEKAQQLTPPTPGGLERGLLWLETRRMLERLLSPAEGFYPKVGNVTTGSGFGAGPAFRRPGLFGGHADFSTFAMGSFTKYWMIDARLAMPRLARGRAYAEILAQKSDFPSEDFFGLGPASRRELFTTFGLRNTIVGGRAGVRPVAWLSFGAGLDHLSPRVRRGEEFGAIDVIFGPDDLPGFLDQPDFVRLEGTAEVNYRTPRGNPRRGGQYTLTLERFDDRTSGRNTFRRVELDVQQYLPVVKDRRVVALRGFLSSAEGVDGRTVPFYMRRTLGGPDDLRGFRRFRFRDENLLLLQAEYRWEIFTAVDGAIFYDAGMVAPRIEELTLQGLESDYGIGFRFGTVNGVFLRIEGAFGSSGGRHFILTFDHVF